MAQTYDRWFVLPIVEYPEDKNGEIVSGPKYILNEDRLGGFSSAGPFGRGEIEEAEFNHILSFNDAEKWRVVHVWGEGTDAWDALNEITALYHDSHTLADHRENVIPVLNERFGRDNWSIN